MITVLIYNGKFPPSWALGDRLHGTISTKLPGLKIQQLRRSRNHRINFLRNFFVMLSRNSPRNVLLNCEYQGKKIDVVATLSVFLIRCRFDVKHNNWTKQIYWAVNWESLEKKSLPYKRKNHLDDSTFCCSHSKMKNSKTAEKFTICSIDKFVMNKQSSEIVIMLD